MEDVKGIAPWLLAALAVLWALVKSFGNREVQRYDDAILRITDMERNHVTREELNEILDRRDERERAMHEENQRALERIERKIDSKNDETNDLAIRVAVLETEANHAR